MIGSNLPHWYRNDAIYYEEREGLEAASIVIQFKYEFLGRDFLDTPETRAIKALLEEASLGLEIQGATREQARRMILQLPHLNGMDRLLHFLSILNLLSRSQEYITLSHQGNVSINAKDSERINRIYEFVMKNFRNPISIDEVSDLVNMCPATFCRYFKKRTRKTFTYFLNEIRIGHACKMLIEKDLSIAEICFASGYNNISYFNRQFKSIKKITPQEFKQEYHDRKKMNRKKTVLALS